MHIFFGEHKFKFVDLCAQSAVKTKKYKNKGLYEKDCTIFIYKNFQKNIVDFIHFFEFSRSL